MSRFTDILLSVVKLGLVLVIGLAIYGWFWFPDFQNGSRNGPYWLLSFYDKGVPFILNIGIVAIVLVGIYRFFAYLWPNYTPPPKSSTFGTLILWFIAITLVGGLPAFIANFDHWDSIEFNNQNYQLVLRQNARVANFLVYECSDPMGLWCRKVTQSPDLQPIPPTQEPLPEEITVGEGEEAFVIQVTPLPTVTPRRPLYY